MTPVDEFLALKDKPDCTAAEIDALWVKLSHAEQMQVLDAYGITPEFQIEFERLMGVGNVGR